MGYHAFVLRYSTNLENKGHMPEFTVEPKMNPKSVHPAPMRDIGRAILIIKDHAEKWLVDESKIALCGFSAGAHNCAMYSVNWNKPVIYDYFGEDPEQFPVHNVILGYGLSDYMMMKKLLEDPIKKKFFAASNIAFTGTPDPELETLKEISPALHVNENTIPMFLWATAEDSLVPVQHTLSMATALVDQKIPFEVHIYEKGEHGLSLAPQASAQVKSQINRDVARWILEAEVWLEKRFMLPVDDLTL